MSAFVGRRDELAALAEISRGVVRGEVAVAVVVGDPGSGKSRLLGEAATRTELPSHFRVVGFEPESEVPLASYMLYTEFKPSDVAYFQKFYDLFTEKGIFEKKVAVDSLLYRG